MILHFFTLSTLVGAVALISFVAMCIVLHIHHKMPGIRPWAGAQAAAALAWGPSMFVNLGVITDPFYTAANNMLNLGSMLLLLEGTLRFRTVRGAPARLPWLYITFGVIVVMSLVNREHAAARYLFHDAVAVLLLSSAAMAMTICAEPYQRLAHRLTAFYLGAQALTYACRWGLAAAVTLGWTDLSPKALNYAAFCAITLCSLGTLYGLILSINAAARRQVILMTMVDPLTRLDNRRALQQGLEQALAERSRSTGMVGIVYFDLNGFKPINDLFGHAAGDHVLKTVANRLLPALRMHDQAARMGGDEFAILLRDLPNPTALSHVADRLRQTIEGPVRLESGMEAVIQVSMGTALAPLHGQDVETLLRHADDGMYREKRSRQPLHAKAPEADLNNPVPS